MTAAILARCEPAQVTGVDSSEQFLAAARRDCPDPRAKFQIGDATALPFADGSFDACVSGLALNFIGAARTLPAQFRVARSGGCVAAYVWDYAGGYEYARRFWDAALEVDARAANYDPGRKSAICSEANLRKAFAETGLTAVETTAFEDSGEFPSREAYWKTFDARQGSTAEYLAQLSEEQLARLKENFLGSLNASGPVRIKTRALAVKGCKP